MKPNKKLGRKPRRAKRARRFTRFVMIGAVSAFAIATMAAAWSSPNSVRKFRSIFLSSPPPPIPPPNNPSKEYIYAGGRLVATEAPAALPAAPTNLGAGWCGLSTTFVAWQDNSENETGFRFERSMDGINFSTVIVLPANTTVLLGYFPGYFRVRAISANGDSAPSNVAQFVPCHDCDAEIMCPENFPEETIWVEDHLPAGAIPAGEETWNWVSSNPGPFSRELSSASTFATEFHQHYFYGATETLTVNNETLIAHVYLDPANPPGEIMLQWNDGTSWDHRAYWGANNINLGVDGTVSRQYQGPLPATGVWVRLEISPDQVGLQGKTLNGLALAVYGGHANWDYIGTSTKPPGNLPAAPANLLATGAGSPQVALTWTASPSAIDHYQVERSSNVSAGYTVIANAGGTSFVDTSVSAGRSYLYRVCAVDAVGHHSPYSTSDLATTITFVENPLISGVTTIKAQHIYELRQAVDAVRACANLSAVNWGGDVTPGITTIQAIHIQSLRTNLDPARSMLGLTPCSYTDNSVAALQTSYIKKEHIEQLRNCTR